MSKVVLAHIYTKEDKEQAHGVIAECKALCAACGFDVTAVVSQQSNSLDPHTAFRSGKLETLKDTVYQTKSEKVVFCLSLSIAATDRIAAYCGCDVLDRTTLILEIFSRRAMSRQAKLQVEAARLQYALPSLAKDQDVETHERGGSFSNRGAGEMRSAVIKRRYQKRIKEIGLQLRAIEKETEVAERRRKKTSLRRAALVGYTNAGKSSFMNAVLKLCAPGRKGVLEKDMLFATLDTSVRNIVWQGKEFLLYDTVGFVSDLPHELIEAFHTTLASVRDADLLVHVIDYADPHWQEKSDITLATLKEIKADNIPILTVYNKIDLTEDTFFPENSVSCLNGTGIKEIMNQICIRLYPVQTGFTILLPYSEMGMLAEARKTGMIQVLEEREEGIVVEISGMETFLRPFQKFRIH